MRCFEKEDELLVGFRDRCASVCDAACRSDTLRDRAREKALLFGRRFA
jgi:hypothetical protein